MSVLVLSFHQMPRPVNGNGAIPDGETLIIFSLCDDTLIRKQFTQRSIQTILFDFGYAVLALVRKAAKFLHKAPRL